MSAQQKSKNAASATGGALASPFESASGTVDLVGFFALLLEIDKRLHPEKYGIAIRTIPND